MTKTKPEHWATLGRRKYPVTIDHNGVARFPRNRIIDDLVEAARNQRKLDLNMIIVRYHDGKYTLNELKGLYLNMGYSVSVIAELSFFEKESMDSCCWRKPKTCSHRAQGSSNLKR